MPQTRRFAPWGLQVLSFAAVAVLYCGLTVWIYLMVPALLGVFALVAVAIGLAGSLKRMTPK